MATREEAAAWRAEPARRPWWAAGVAWLRPLTAVKAAGAAFVIVTVAGLAVLVWGVLRTSGDSGQFDAPAYWDLRGRVVYLAPASNDSLLGTRSALAGAGIALADSVPGLRKAVQPDTAAVIVDREFATAVDHGWLNQLLASGVVIVGARMNVFDLVREAGGAGPQREQFDFYAPPQVYFTLYAHVGACGGGAQGLAGPNDAVAFRQFLSTLARHTHSVCGS